MKHKKTAFWKLERRPKHRAWGVNNQKISLSIGVKPKKTLTGAILNMLMKQAGTCISCEDLNKKYLYVKRDRIEWNFVISK